jgi:hypothetical protein
MSDAGKNLGWTIAFAIAVFGAVLATAKLSGISAHAQAPPERAMWVWEDAIIQTPAAVSELLAFAKDKKLNALYFYSERALTRDQASLAGFIAAAQRQGVKVALLFGEPEWVLAAHHVEAIDFARMAARFADNLGQAPRPAGIRFDVEPHALGQWATSQQALAAQFLSLVASLQDVRGSLPLGIDYPFGYESVSVTRSLNGAPVTQSLASWIISLADDPVLMDYRNHAEAPDGIIDHAQASIDYASRTGKRVAIGVETGCQATPPKVTFCGKSAADLEAQLGVTAQHYAGARGFAGFAIHDYKGYQSLGR